MTNAFKLHAELDNVTHILSPFASCENRMIATEDTSLYFLPFVVNYRKKNCFQPNRHGRTDYNYIIARTKEFGETHNVNRGNINKVNLHLRFHY